MPVGRRTQELTLPKDLKDRYFAQLTRGLQASSRGAVISGSGNDGSGMFREGLLVRQPPRYSAWYSDLQISSPKYIP